MGVLSGERGMTLIEVLVALVLVAIILLPLIGSLTTGFLATREGERIAIATSLAQGEMEGLLGGFNRPQEAPADYRINTRIEDNGDGTENIIVVVGWGDEGAKEKEIRLQCCRKR